MFLKIFKNIYIILQDLTFIDTGNPDTIKTPTNRQELINFIKLRKTAIIIKNMQLFQQTGYSLEIVKEIQEYLLKIKEINFNEEESYKISLSLEPRDL